MSLATMATRQAGGETVNLDPLDLNNTVKFWCRRGVPILDEHELRLPPDQDGVPRPDDVFDAARLGLIAANSNRLASYGEYAVIRIGHVDYDRSIPEEHQPKPVGFIRNFRLAPWVDSETGEVLKPGQHVIADFYYFLSVKPEDVATYPHRSIEMDRHRNVIDGVSLLRRPPERPLGLLTYARAEKHNIVSWCLTAASAGSTPATAAARGKSQAEAHTNAKVVVMTDGIARIKAKLAALSASFAEASAGQAAIASGQAAILSDLERERELNRPMRLAYRRQVVEDLARRGVAIDVETTVQRTENLDHRSFKSTISGLEKHAGPEPTRPRPVRILTEAERLRASKLVETERLSPAEALRRVRSGV